MSEKLIDKSYLMFARSVILRNVRQNAKFCIFRFCILFNMLFISCLVFIKPGFLLQDRSCNYTKKTKTLFPFRLKMANLAYYRYLYIRSGVSDMGDLTPCVGRTCS